MKGMRFAFSIKRNITIIRGDSATGKTTLFSMIEEYGNLGKDSGVQIQCDKACVALSGKYWQEALEKIHDSIVFVDEDSKILIAFLHCIHLGKFTGFALFCGRNIRDSLFG